MLHLVHQNIKLLFFYEFYIHKISILFKSYFYGNFKFCFFFYFTKSTKKKYYAVDVRNSCNTTCSVSFCFAEKKRKIFSRTFRFLHFFVRTFSFFTFSGAWKTTKAFFFCLSLFLLASRSFLFTLSLQLRCMGYTKIKQTFMS